MELDNRLSKNRLGLLHIGVVPYKTIHLEKIYVTENSKCM